MKHTLHIGAAACLAALLAACGGGGDADPGHYAGGTVTGLNAGNSVLLSSGPHAITLNADGSYRFGRFPKGTAYEISATSAEPSQVCAVANGSGQIGDEDVTNVQVSCATAYGVGGTVSGYPGSGLSLSLNGAQTLPITADGPFEFGAFLLPQSAYAVTIASQPAGHECTVAQGSGTMPAARVSDVAVSCRPSTGRLAYAVTGMSHPDSLSLLLTGAGMSPSTREVRAISGNGSGQFDSLLNAGSGYQVGFQQAPSRHECSLAQASGTFDAQAPGTVRVNCSFLGYQIDGQVVVYPGTSITLTLYGTNDDSPLETLTFTAPSTNDPYVVFPFVFNSRFSTGQSYQIVYDYVFGDSFLECESTSNTNGTIADADVTATLVCVTSSTRT